MYISVQHLHFRAVKQHLQQPTPQRAILNKIFPSRRVTEILRDPIISWSNAWTQPDYRELSAGDTIKNSAQNREHSMNPKHEQTRNQHTLFLFSFISWKRNYINVLDCVNRCSIFQFYLSKSI